MEYIYAALLLHKLKQDVTEDNVKKIIEATGISPDEVKVKALVAALGDVNIDDALKTATFAQSPTVTSTPAPATEATEASKEPKEEEKKEEEALEGLSSLFG